MNETIVKIVGTLFEDLEDSEEIRALHEEILTNCQDRYDDLTASGASSDEAIHAVVESLKGMEDMLKDYPRRPQATEKKPNTWTYDLANADIRKIHLTHLGGASVSVFPSADSLVHAECSSADVMLVTSVAEGVLSFALTEDEPENVAQSVDLSDLGRLFSRLCKRLTEALEPSVLSLSIPENLLASLTIEAASGDVEVRRLRFSGLSINTSSGDIQLSDLCVEDSLLVNAASGDLEMERLTLERFKANTASGDIELSDLCARDKLSVNTASGDISLRDACAASMEIKSASGDIEANDLAALETISVSSSSGDVHMSGAAAKMYLRTASGDLSAAAAGQMLTSLHGESNSGDISIRLPAGLSAAISCRSRTGDIRMLAPSDPAAAAVVELVTNSGDITVK